MYRMSEKQAKAARSLIRDKCCNYDSTTGGCLLLDYDGGGVCPQTITQSLLCVFFRDVVLEDKQGRELKAEITKADHLKTCTVCGQQFRATSNRAKYCAKCAKETRLKQKRQYIREKRGGV